MSLKIALLAFFGWEMWTRVSIAHVVANVPSISDIGSSYAFWLAAFSNTELMVQVALIGVVFFAALLFKDAYSGRRSVAWI
ncbi:MAG: hypothetical protein WC797_03845 [Candidatus Paceibacterota bacterium]|jgi:hypothetical protein